MYLNPVSSTLSFYVCYIGVIVEGLLKYSIYNFCKIHAMPRETSSNNPMHTISLPINTATKSPSRDVEQWLQLLDQIPLII
jgi:hypothetical protein